MGFFDKLFSKKELDTVDYGNLPVHIAIIMDGNGRWAKKRGMSRSVGHREGSNTLEKITEFCDKIGIKYLTVYAFSTENWKRPKNEVDTLMSLLLEFLRKAEKKLAGKSIRINVIGNTEKLPVEIQDEIKKVEEVTKKNAGLNLNIALNYGGRDEIVNAVKAIARDVKQGSLNIDALDEQVISDRLYTWQIPEPDLLIRTSGEQRLSNFLIWQLAYSEFWFTDVLWPDFTSDHLLEAIKGYQSRKRRFGGV